jgi:predicted DCC family thiol-disulfide oxidoreductase YuxK
MSRWRIKVLIDGACPLCRREADFWRKLDRGRGCLALEDISAPEFDPTAYGLTRQQVMDQIHAVLPSGATIQGMEVFRRAYAAIGWGWLAAPTGWPVLRPVFDRLYTWFARNRLRFTGRSVCNTGQCGSAEPGRDAQAQP